MDQEQKSFTQMTPFPDRLTTWLPMCASKFARKSSKACSRLALNWTSTDSALESHLITFVCYEKDRKIEEEFLFSNVVSVTTTAADVKGLVNSFLKPTNSVGRISSTFVLTVPQQ